MIWFTSDLHLGHVNIATGAADRWKDKHRGFMTIEDHDRTILENINSRVRKDDELWILGDFTLSTKKHLINEYRRCVRCEKVYLLIGNHDRTVEKLYRKGHDIPWFTKVYADFYGTVGHHKIHMYHYPIGSWRGMHRGVWHLHGHTHGRHPARENMLDVSLETQYKRCGHYAPFSIEEINHIFKLREEGISLGQTVD